MMLAGDEFLRRFLQHVLPRGFHKVRYYGVWRPAAAPIRARLQQQLAAPPAASSATPTMGGGSTAAAPASPRADHCRQCALGHVRIIRHLARLWSVSSLPYAGVPP